MIVAWGGTTFRNVRAIRSRARSNSVRTSTRTDRGSSPSEMSRATRWATLCTMAIAGCASERRLATSPSDFGSGWPFASMTASPIASRARRASFDAPLVRSSAMERIVSSTGAASMLHPFVIRREAGDAHADATLEEIPRVAFRGAAAHVVQLAEDPVLADCCQPVPDDSGPGRICRHHRLDCGRGLRVGPIVAEEEAARLEGEQSPERLEVLLQVERGGRRDRHEDLVAGKVEARGVACVHTAVEFVEDRQLVRRMPRRIEEDEGMLPELESITVFDGDQPVDGNRLHRPEHLRFGRPERLSRTRDESRGVDEMLVAPLVDVDLRGSHGVDQEPGSSGMIEVNVGHHDGIDLLGPETERVHRLEDSFRVPRGARLDDRLSLVVDQVDGPEGRLAEHADVGQVGLRVERKRLKGHRCRWIGRLQMYLCVKGGEHPRTVYRGERRTDVHGVRTTGYRYVGLRSSQATAGSGGPAVGRRGRPATIPASASLEGGPRHGHHSLRDPRRSRSRRVDSDVDLTDPAIPIGRRPGGLAPLGNLFLVDGGFPEFAAVAKHGNGAGFRVSSCRGSQVRILAAASLLHIEQCDLLEDEVGPSDLRDGPRRLIGDAQVFEGLSLRVEASVVAGPSHVANEVVDRRRTEEDHADGRRVRAEADRPNRVLNLTRPGRIEEGLHRNGPRGYRPRVPRPDRVKGRGLEMIPAEDRSCIEEGHLGTAGGRPLRRGANHGLRMDHGSFRPRNIEGHAKSPSAAWPSISRTSTGTPTCSLIFIARAEPIVGMRASSLGFAFCRSFSVL